MEKTRIRDQDKHPGSAKQDLDNQLIIKPFVEKVFWDKIKSFLKSKAASVPVN
jgi:hypothetical protein